MIINNCFIILNINIINNLNPIKNKNNKFFHGRIFISFMYNNEAEMAYILIWRLYDYVDKFIIVVSNVTYTGHPKIVSFKPFEKNIKPYMAG